MRAGEVLWASAVAACLVPAGCSRKAEEGAKAVGASRVQTTCPVMAGNPIDRSLYVDHEGKRIYVCCAECVDAVKADPSRYIRKLEAAGVVLEKVPAAQVWTCPMHPEVRQDKAGKCPECGMDLVPAKEAKAAP